MKELIYDSITYGKVTETQVFKIVAEKLKTEDEFNKYELFVGTDSQVYDKTNMALIIAIHNIGKGGIFFLHKERLERFHDLRSRMYHEVMESIEAGKRLTEFLFNEGLNFHITIHLDIGENGKTKDLIREITGMVSSYGFDYKIKPDAVAASSIADKYNK